MFRTLACHGPASVAGGMAANLLRRTSMVGPWDPEDVRQPASSVDIDSPSSTVRPFPVFCTGMMKSCVLFRNC